MAQPPAKTYGNVSGIVYRADSAGGLEGVKVTERKMKKYTFTDKDGRYFLYKVRAGDNVVYASTQGYCSESVACIVRTGETTNLNIPMWAGTGMNGRVRKKLRPRGAKEVFIGPQKGMIDYNNTGTVRTVTADEINKLPGH